MKVLFIIDTIQGSGAERSIVEIAQHFKTFTPVFVHIYKGDMLKPELERSGISVYSLNINKKYGFKDAVTQLIRIYKKEKPDLVHSTLYRADMVARKLKSKFPDIPLIGSFVNNSYTPLRYKNQSLTMKIKMWLAYRLDKQSSKKVDFFISNSETIKKSEGSALGISPNKIEVIYRGRDISRYNNLEESNSELIKSSLGIESDHILINVSRLIPRKAQLDIINALPAVIKEFPDTILLIAGHGVYKSILENRINELNLQKHIKLLGRRLDIPDLLNLSKVFVYPSYAEGLPGALIEAMMAGKLIIASNIGENLECVDDTSALIFKKGDVNELSDKIIYALSYYSKLGYLRENARVQAQHKFKIQNIAEKYEKLYISVLENY